MKIYFSCSISGGRKFLEVDQQIVRFLKENGHKVLSEHVVDPIVLEKEKNHTDQYIYERDINWIHECDLVIAEVSNPSLGVGYEICYALNYNRPVFCLYNSSIFLSRMLSGNTMPGLLVQSYSGVEWKKYITDFLNNHIK